MAEFVSLDYVKTILRLPLNETEDDPRLKLTIRAVCSMIENDLAYPVGEETVTKYYSGDGGPVLFLDERYITSIVNIWLDNSGWFGSNPSGFDASTLLVNGTDYALMVEGDGEACLTGMVRRINAVWPAPARFPQKTLVSERDIYRGNIKASYVTGYPMALVPEDIKWAAAIMVGLAERKNDGGGPIGGFSFEGFSQSFGQDSPEDMTSIQSILSSHRKWILPR